VCTQFREGLNQLRSVKDEAIERACSEVVIISPRILEILNRTNGSASPRCITPAPKASPPHECAQPSAPNQQQYTELLVAPYTEADMALAFSEIRALQQHYPKIKFGAAPISIKVPEDRRFMRGLMLRLRGESAAEASDLRLFLPWAFLQIFPDPNSLGKAMPKADSIGVFYRLAERFHEAQPGTYGQAARAAAQAEQEERERLRKMEDATRPRTSL